MFIKNFCFAFFLFVTPLIAQNSNFYVGDVGSQWEFGTDHLPVGITVNQHHFVSWNILDKSFIHWIETNEQGLVGSAILRDNVPLHSDNTLTKREELIIRQILTMAEHPTHPRSIIALQETNSDVYHELQKRLPEWYKPASHQNRDQGEVVFYDNNLFEEINYKSGVYSNAKNTWMILKLKDRRDGKIYTLVHSHVPGGKKSDDARTELAEQVMSNFDENEITLVVGDQNRAPHFFERDLIIAANKMNRGVYPFINLKVPYPTHVSTRKEACWIDNLFLADSKNQVETCQVSKYPHEFFQELEIPLALFRQLSPYKS